MSGVSRASDAMADQHFTEAVGLSAPSPSPSTHIGDSPYLVPLDLEDRHWAEAEHFIRRASNRHGCVNQHDRDASCTSPRHAQDVQMALYLLYATGCRADPEAQWQPGHPRAGKRRRVKNAAGEPG